MVSPFLFPNDIRGVRESAMMGMDLGPHTYQALSFTFLISFFHTIVGHLSLFNRFDFKELSKG